MNMPHYAQFQMLGALQRRNLYSGTVPAHVVAARRRRNKAARAARRLNRARPHVRTSGLADPYRHPIARQSRLQLGYAPRS